MLKLDILFNAIWIEKQLQVQIIVDSVNIELIIETEE